MPKTCQCAVCGQRRADIATIFGQFACFDCLIEASAAAVDAGEFDEGTTLADGMRFDSADLTQEWADGMRAAYPHLFRS